MWGGYTHTHTLQSHTCAILVIVGCKGTLGSILGEWRIIIKAEQAVVRGSDSRGVHWNS